MQASTATRLAGTAGRTPRANASAYRSALARSSSVTLTRSVTLRNDDVDPTGARRRLGERGDSGLAPLALPASRGRYFTVKCWNISGSCAAQYALYFPATSLRVN